MTQVCECGRAIERPDLHNACFRFVIGPEPAPVRPVAGESFDDYLIRSGHAEYVHGEHAALATRVHHLQRRGLDQKPMMRLWDIWKTKPPVRECDC